MHRAHAKYDRTNVQFVVVKSKEKFYEYEETTVFTTLGGKEPQNSPAVILLNQFQLFKAFHNSASNR